MSMAIAYQMKKRARQDRDEDMGPCKMCEGGSCPKHMMAKGGEVRHDEDDEHDIVSRIMKKRSYSEGGRIANEDHGEDDGKLAGFLPNEFDELTLDDDLEDHDSEKNSGDELGDHQEDDDRRDIVSRIMKSRKLRDKMPGTMRMGN